MVHEQRAPIAQDGEESKPALQNLDAFSSQSGATSEKEVGRSGKRQGRPEQVSIFPTLASRGTISRCPAFRKWFMTRGLQLPKVRGTKTGIWMIQLLHLQQISYGKTLK